MFGFYPSELYWRPILAFVLLLAALAPILFSDSAPRQMLYLTAAYPFVMPWLMWGGPIWGRSWRCRICNWLFHLSGS